MAGRLVDSTDAAAAREPDEPDLLEALEPKTQAETEPQSSNRGEADSTVPTVEAGEATDGGARKTPKTPVTVNAIPSASRRPFQGAASNAWPPTYPSSEA
jgi:hypothetical protein